MSEPAVFVLVRDGEKNYYHDRWASVFLYREIIWGPEQFENWVRQLEPLDAWSDDAAAGVVVDFDRRTLVWSGDTDQLRIPKVAAVYERLLQAAWPGYEIQHAATGLPGLATAAGVPDADDYDSEMRTRNDSVRLAAGFSEDEGGDEDEETNYGDEPRAWVTVIDSGSAVRHRQLLELPSDLLEAKEGVIDDLITLEAAEVPPESLVVEGMWIDQPRRSIGLWGGEATRAVLRQVQESWPDWKVRWADRGYAEQCQVSGPCGIPMSETEALARFLPIVLSTKRFDVGNIMGAVGSHLKRTAIKATGCLLCLMCFPVLLFGLISGNWKAALITIGVVCAVVVVLFKILEFRFRRSMAATTRPLRGAASDDNRALVAGPLNEQDRRQLLDQLLLAAGFPPLKSIEPSFRKDDDILELLQD